jgi:hypothetical protein
MLDLGNERPDTAGTLGTVDSPIRHDLELVVVAGKAEVARAREVGLLHQLGLLAEGQDRHLIFSNMLTMAKTAK